MEIRFNKQDVLQRINHSAVNDKPIFFDFKDLRFAFGFTRMDGKDILMYQLIHPNATEESLQTAPDYEIHKNIENWCRENNIKYYYDYNTNRYEFYKKKLQGVFDTLFPDKV